MMQSSEANNPRAETVTAERDIRPVVQKPRSGFSGPALALGALVAAFILFVILDGSRRARTAPATIPSPSLASQSAAPPPLYIPPQPQPTPVASPPPEPIPQTASSPPPPTPAPQIVYMQAPASAPAAPPAPPRNLSAPALVIDAGETINGPATRSAPTQSSTSSELGQPGVERAHAAMFSEKATTVPQGTLIPAILETALDSSHDGFARALVQRDIRGFDGSKVLIPRGSRLIGQYKGNVARGQRRAFILWSRLIRPDGVTIALNSPAADPVGSGGVKAHVNSHFFARFSGAILQSVLDLGVNLASRTNNSSVVVALPGSLQGTTNTVVQPTQIAPTLTVKPGTSVSVFVARDLDFSGAKEAGREQ